MPGELIKGRWRIPKRAANSILGMRPQCNFAQKYQPCSQATFSLSHDVIFLMTSALLGRFLVLFNLQSAICGLQSANVIHRSQRMLFDPTPNFLLFYIYFIGQSAAEVLGCFGIRTEEIQLTESLKNLQVSKALVVAADKIPLNVSNHRFEAWSLHMLDSWLNISVDYFTRRYVKPEWLVKMNV